MNNKPFHETYNFNNARQMIEDKIQNARKAKPIKITPQIIMYIGCVTVTIFALLGFMIL